MSDFIAIETLINDYFQALHHKDVAKIEAIFWDHASITGYYEGEFVHSKLHDYLSILKRMSAPNMIGEDFDMEVVSIELKGNMAAVKTRYLFQALEYVDFLTLLNINGQWKIIQKTFYHD